MFTKNSYGISQTACLQKANAVPQNQRASTLCIYLLEFRTLFILQVENPFQAVKDLENFLSLKLSDSDENTREVPERLVIDIVRLEEYLKTKLGLNSSGI